jgi:hypothetical protein
MKNGKREAGGGREEEGEGEGEEEEEEDAILTQSITPIGVLRILRHSFIYRLYRGPRWTFSYQHFSGTCCIYLQGKLLYSKD